MADTSRRSHSTGSVVTSCLPHLMRVVGTISRGGTISSPPSTSWSTFSMARNFPGLTSKRGSRTPTCSFRTSYAIDWSGTTRESFSLRSQKIFKFVWRESCASSLTRSLRTIKSCNACSCALNRLNKWTCRLGRRVRWMQFNIRLATTSSSGTATWLTGYAMRSSLKIARWIALSKSNLIPMARLGDRAASRVIATIPSARLLGHATGPLVAKTLTTYKLLTARTMIVTVVVKSF